MASKKFKTVSKEKKVSKTKSKKQDLEWIKRKEQVGFYRDQLKDQFKERYGKPARFSVKLKGDKIRITRIDGKDFTKQEHEFFRERGIQLGLDSKTIFKEQQEYSMKRLDQLFIKVQKYHKREQETETELRLLTMNAKYYHLHLLEYEAMENPARIDIEEMETDYDNSMSKINKLERDYADIIQDNSEYQERLKKIKAKMIKPSIKADKSRVLFEDVQKAEKTYKHHKEKEKVSESYVKHYHKRFLQAIEYYERFTGKKYVKIK